MIEFKIDVMTDGKTIMVKVTWDGGSDTLSYDAEELRREFLENVAALDHAVAESLANVADLIHRQGMGEQF